jgi:hypothetical protein
MPSLIGNKPNQVPTNGDLGTLAFEDHDNVNITGGAISGNIATTGLNIDSNTLVVDSTNDRIGVGTASPTVRLDIRNTGGGAGSTLQIGSGQNDIGTIQFLNTTGSTVNSTITGNLDGGNAGGDLRFSTKPVSGSLTERVRVTGAGNVGIGTSSPQAKLEIAVSSGSATQSRQFFQASGASAAASFMRLTNTGADAVIGIADSGGTAIVSGGTAYATQIYTVNSTPLQFGTNSTIKATLDSSGNLGLGVTPSAWNLSNYTALELKSAGNAIYSAQNDVWFSKNAYYNNSWKYGTTAAATAYNLNADKHTWYNAASGTAGNAITWTAAMTLDGSGNLLVGKTSSSGATVGFEASTAGFVSTASNTFAGWMNRTTSDGDILRFARNATGVGSVSVTTTATSYNTSSDYRLKENIAPMTGALATVAQLKPVTYQWKSDGSAGQGFIAHELAAVVPDAVTGEKDAVDEEGKPVYQGIDTSFLVATLTAAIQELKAEVDSLKSELLALKG